MRDRKGNGHREQRDRPALPHRAERDDSQFDIDGADLYDSDLQRAANARAGRPNLGIDSDSVLDGVIADKNCAIGRKVRIQRHSGLDSNCDVKGVYVRDGIIVVPKDAVLPDGWSL